MPYLKFIWSKKQLFENTLVRTRGRFLSAFKTKFSGLFAEDNFPEIILAYFFFVSQRTFVNLNKNKFHKNGRIEWNTS